MGESFLHSHAHSLGGWIAHRGWASSSPAYTLGPVLGFIGPFARSRGDTRAFVIPGGFGAPGLAFLACPLFGVGCFKYLQAQHIFHDPAGSPPRPRPVPRGDGGRRGEGYPVSEKKRSLRPDYLGGYPGLCGAVEHGFLNKTSPCSREGIPPPPPPSPPPGHRARGGREGEGEKGSPPSGAIPRGKKCCSGYISALVST